MFLFQSPQYFSTEPKHAEGMSLRYGGGVVVLLRMVLCCRWTQGSPRLEPVV